MKTKEEILDHLAILNDCYLDDRYRTTALQAMQEYAKQYHKEQLRKEWIRFASYNFKEALRVNYDMEQIALYVDEYLKDK